MKVDFDNINDVADEMFSWAKSEYPKEMCGVIVFDEQLQFIPINNLADKYGVDERDAFVMCPRTYSSIDEHNNIVAIVHSHPDSNTAPSEHDKIRCNQGEIPWVIISYPDKDINIIHPTDEKQPLLGRTFIHGVQDCWSLVRDYYKEVFNIHLNDYERQDEWWMKGEDLYLDNLESEGFIEISEKDMQVGDVLFMQIESPTTNHAAVLCEDGMIIHHLYGKPSYKGIYGGYWRERTTRILRHKERDKQLPLELRINKGV